MFITLDNRERNQLIAAKIKAFTKMMVERGPKACREYLEKLK